MISYLILIFTLSQAVQCDSCADYSLYIQEEPFIDSYIITPILTRETLWVESCTNNTDPGCQYRPECLFELECSMDSEIITTCLDDVKKHNIIGIDEIITTTPKVFEKIVSIASKGTTTDVLDYTNAVTTEDIDTEPDAVSTTEEYSSVDEEYSTGTEEYSTGTEEYSTTSEEYSTTEEISTKANNTALVGVIPEPSNNDTNVVPIVIGSVVGATAVSGMIFLAARSIKHLMQSGTYRIPE